jgi:hypothetical protein
MGTNYMEVPKRQAAQRHEAKVYILQIHCPEDTKFRKNIYLPSPGSHDDL